MAFISGNRLYPAAAAMAASLKFAPASLLRLTITGSLAEPAPSAMPAPPSSGGAAARRLRSIASSIAAKPVSTLQFEAAAAAAAADESPAEMSDTEKFLYAAGSCCAMHNILPRLACCLSA